MAKCKALTGLAVKGLITSAFEGQCRLAISDIWSEKYSSTHPQSFPAVISKVKFCMRMF